MNKRIVTIADLHSGHLYGLTPPQHRYMQSAMKEEIQVFSSDLWNFYSASLKKLSPIDILIVNGDAIDGRGEITGGRELITTDRNTQVDMATECIKEANAKEIYMTFGSAYHTGKTEDWEMAVSKLVDAEVIKDHLSLDINGCIFDVRHYLPGGNNLMNRASGLSRANLANILFKMRDTKERANIIIRSHIHSFNYSGDRSILSLTTPALAHRSIFGTRHCEAPTDIGIVYFDVNEKGDYSWGTELADFASLKERTIKV